MGYSQGDRLFWQLLARFLSFQVHSIFRRVFNIPVANSHHVWWMGNWYLSQLNKLSATERWKVPCLYHVWGVWYSRQTSLKYQTIIKLWAQKLTLYYKLNSGIFFLWSIFRKITAKTSQLLVDNSVDFNIFPTSRVFLFQVPRVNLLEKVKTTFSAKTVYKHYANNVSNSKCSKNCLALMSILVLKVLRYWNIMSRW